MDYGGISWTRENAVKRNSEREILSLPMYEGFTKLPMAESIIAHILSIKKSLPLVAENQKQRDWFRRVQSIELHGSTALIIGPGAIGGEVGRILQAFGVKTIGCNRSGHAAPYMDEMTSFEQIADVLPIADIVISILPSTEETKGLITYEHFKSMKPSAIFMNYGRGDVVKETDILQAMQEEWIAYAVLDVFENEPLAAGSPILGNEQCNYFTSYIQSLFTILSKSS